MMLWPGKWGTPPSRASQEIILLLSTQQCMGTQIQKLFFFYYAIPSETARTTYELLSHPGPLKQAYFRENLLQAGVIRTGVRPQSSH
jgi:hypothetical protein